jgi:redox-sensitive bicupin YhaK (pirin superfamily)
MHQFIIHKSASRGYANHGWLIARHTFSFARYHDSERMNFGVLRVMNDDIIGAGMGFGTHPHDNMEIITIPLSGDLAHKDSMGNEAIIRHGDIQVMSAGKGILHSEFNPNKDIEAKILQIWMFPNKQNVEPRYDQISLNLKDQKNELQQILSPNPDDAGVWVHQEAWFFMGKFDKNQTFVYKSKKEGNGLYAFIIKGSAKVRDLVLETRDGFGIWDYDQISFHATEDLEILLMDVPMK